MRMYIRQSKRQSTAVASKRMLGKARRGESLEFYDWSTNKYSAATQKKKKERETL